MSQALELIADLSTKDIKLSLSGNKLHVDGPESALTDELLGSLKEHKQGLISILGESICGIPLTELVAEAGEDWQELENNPDMLESFANAIQLKRMRTRGEVPPEYTSTTVCTHCGLVPIFEGAPSHVLGCPWCMNRCANLPMPK